jgi:hypothetical protein
MDKATPLADYDIGIATRDDVSAILDLQKQNLRKNGGALSVPFSRDWFEAAVADMPIIVARRAGNLVGYLVSCPLAAQAHSPIIRAMLRAYRGPPDAYNYGPVCVAESERRKGLAATMFKALCARLPGREGVTFIRQDNIPSVGAHLGMGMRQVAEFIVGDATYLVPTYRA